MDDTTTSSLAHVLETLIAILPFPAGALLHLALCYFRFLRAPLATSRVLGRASLDGFLNLLFHILQSPFITPRPFPISSSTIPVDAYLSPFTDIFPTPFVLPPPAPNCRASVLITNNYDDHPLALQLGLQFAQAGYHVFIQVSGQSQLSEVIVRWQRLKSELNKRHQRQRSPFCPPHPPHLGALIPLLYLTHDLDRRNEAISTVRAYARAESIDMISLVHVIHPHFIRRPAFPPSPSFSPLRSTRRLSIGTRIPDDLPPTPSIPITPPPTSVFYPATPIPLTVCAESFLCDAFNDILLGPLSTTQDFLPTLVALRGRVVHVCCSSGDGLFPRMALEGLGKLVEALGVEFKTFRIPVSLVMAPSISDSLDNLNQDVQLTKDVRSMLTEDTDPFILRVFEHQAETAGVARKQQVRSVDGAGVYRMVRCVLETRYPRKVYPLGPVSLLHELVDALKTSIRGEVELEKSFG